MKAIVLFVLTLASVGLLSCQKQQELSIAEIQRLTASTDAQLLAKTVSKPYNNQEFVPGTLGGVWNTTILADPKTFNHLIAERDADSAGIIGMTTDYLVDYNAVTREWEPRAASFEITVDEAAGTLTVRYTLRDDLYWSWWGSDRKLPVTADDVVYWHDEIAGDPQFGSSAYNGQFVTMADGTQERIRCVKVDDKRFDFIFPRIVAEPLLSTNTSIQPAFLFREAKERNGAEGVKGILNASINPKEIPSCGRWFITEYTPAQRLVFTRNPDYWEKDSGGTSNPYPQQMIAQIVGDMNTQYLLFRQGKSETYFPRPEELSDVVNAQADDYTVFNAEGSFGSMLWSFNQNPKNQGHPYYRWFTQKKFRQAMSCLLNRDRIISQTYRGLGDPTYFFFPPPNPFYNPDITLQYRYDRQRALSLLESIGFVRRDDGLLYDSNGVRVEYDLTIPSANTVVNDVAQIIADECAAIGITVHVRQIDFQKVIEMLTATYDWQSVIIGLGTSLFPTQGSNVWPSDGNLHLWHPLQESPATEWEARIDYLYNEGSYTLDRERAGEIWSEYQRILLEECPVIYLIRSRGFAAVRNKWDFSNLYYDNLNGLMTDWVYLRGSGQ
ncbi:MAG: ABC transporter substrate-binding protein [Spirochaetaceae bacterium]|nr:ABC transporter substrate-binding protein [Spirochaetaceae bacterium]MBR2462955.1 ABC transporter substrate-binding protein [Spirochaetaceae bacterium]